MSFDVPPLGNREDCDVLLASTGKWKPAPTLKHYYSITKASLGVRGGGGGGNPLLMEGASEGWGREPQVLRGRLYD